MGSNHRLSETALLNSQLLSPHTQALRSLADPGAVHYRRLSTTLRVVPEWSRGSRLRRRYGPATIVAMSINSTSRVQVALSVATNLWINWGWIALDHRDEARASRERDGQPTGNAELQASMVSIVASAFAIDGFATVVGEVGTRPAREETWGRATTIWETLRTNFGVGSKTQTWPRELKELWRLRSARGADRMFATSGVTGPFGRQAVPLGAVAERVSTGFA